jgi:hypothetical protein
MIDGAPITPFVTCAPCTPLHDAARPPRTLDAARAMADVRVLRLWVCLLSAARASRSRQGSERENCFAPPPGASLPARRRFMPWRGPAARCAVSAEVNKVVTTTLIPDPHYIACSTRFAACVCSLAVLEEVITRWIISCLSCFFLFAQRYDKLCAESRGLPRLLAPNVDAASFYTAP